MDDLREVTLATRIFRASNIMAAKINHTDLKRLKVNFANISEAKE